MAIALTGQRALNFWSGAERDAKFDVTDLKGLVEELLEQFGVRGVAITRREAATPLFLESAAITLGGNLPSVNWVWFRPCSPKIRSARRRVARRVESRSTPRPPECHEVLQSTAAISPPVVGTWRCSCPRPSRTTPCCRP